MRAGKIMGRAERGLSTHKKWFRRTACPGCRFPRISMRLTRLAIATAPAWFVLLWSTGFIGARYGMPYIEPLTFLAVRMVFVVVIMAAIALAGGARWPYANEVGHSLVAGSLCPGPCFEGVLPRLGQVY